jgi:hypothetical protein
LSITQQPSATTFDARGPGIRAIDKVGSHNVAPDTNVVVDETHNVA